MRSLLPSVGSAILFFACGGPQAPERSVECTADRDCRAPLSGMSAVWCEEGRCRVEYVSHQDPEWQHLDVQIVFAEGSDELPDDALPTIVELTRQLSERNDVTRLRAEGYATSAEDEHGSLASRRAAVVAEALAAEGVPREMLEAVGYSASGPDALPRVEVSLLLRD